MITKIKNWLAYRRFRRHVKMAKRCETDIFYQNKLDLDDYWFRLPYQYLNLVKTTALSELKVDLIDREIKTHIMKYQLEN